MRMLEAMFELCPSVADASQWAIESLEAIPIGATLGQLPSLDLRLHDTVFPCDAWFEEKQGAILEALQTAPLSKDSNEPVARTLQRNSEPKQKRHKQLLQRNIRQ